jgi:hypothetical protein
MIHGATVMRPDRGIRDRAEKENGEKNEKTGLSPFP